MDPSLNPDPVDAGMDELGNVLVPEGPHGNVQEVVAANVAPEERIFPAAAMARMDAACGAQQSLRAIMMTDEEAASDARRQSWRHWKAAKKTKPSPSPEP